MKLFTLVTFTVVLLAGCSAQAPAPQSEVQANVDAPIDCATAAADIQTLTNEKARTALEVKDGASSIFPIGAVAHILGGSEKESLEIGTGEYNKKLDTKISQIKLTCGL